MPEKDCPEQGKMDQDSKNAGQNFSGEVVMRAVGRIMFQRGSSPGQAGHGCRSGGLAVNALFRHCGYLNKVNDLKKSEILSPPVYF